MWFPVYKTTVRESAWITTKSRIEKYIIPEFGDLLFERIDVKAAQKAVNEWAKKFGMYTKLLSYVKRIGDYAVGMAIISINPFRQVTNPAHLTKNLNDKKERRNRKKKELKFYSKNQLNAFLGYCKNRLTEIPESRKVQYYYAHLDYALFQLMSYSGARIGEILALTWSDIDFMDQSLNIDKTLSKTNSGYVIEDPQNDESIRVIDIDSDTLKILKKWQFRQKELLLKNGLTNHEYVFTDIEGKWMYRTDTYQRSKRIAKAAGVPFIGNHGFRHTHATMLFAAGVAPKEIQHRLGHASVTITMDTYTHLVKNNKVKQ